ncbi:hypothetical protein B0A49_00658 [Cryomyces minteri]|uniref:Uncharacterized protein n=1 Tax=Cryomyces minteri TaxID=331657 RepID=A0A4V5NJR6_9PEZI|nr:hypothetical protein B0A49_00658 [Cryomyces minteri]
MAPKRNPEDYERITGLALHDQTVEEYESEPPMLSEDNDAGPIQGIRNDNGVAASAAPLTGRTHGQMMQERDEDRENEDSPDTRSNYPSHGAILSPLALYGYSGADHGMDAVYEDDVQATEGSVAYHWCTKNLPSQAHLPCHCGRCAPERYGPRASAPSPEIARPAPEPGTVVDNDEDIPETAPSKKRKRGGTRKNVRGTGQRDTAALPPDNTSTPTIPKSKRGRPRKAEKEEKTKSTRGWPLSGVEGEILFLPAIRAGSIRFIDDEDFREDIEDDDNQ